MMTTNYARGLLFTAEEGAEDHCQVAALSLSNQRIFDWLDDEVYKNPNTQLSTS
jgi:hypothetical protein